MVDLIPIAPITRTVGDLNLVVTMAGVGEQGLVAAVRANNGHTVYAGTVCLDDSNAVHLLAVKISTENTRYAATEVEGELREFSLPTEGAYRTALKEQRYNRRGAEEDTGTEPQPWPDPLDDRAWYGLAGEIAHAMVPHTEADPAAVLVTVLLFLGNMIGHLPHLPISGTRHTVNEFAVIVGPSAKARKGSSVGHPLRFSSLLDPVWVKTRRMAGLSSGEGLVNAVRDPEVGRDGDLVDAGATDKRLMVVESEFASVLRVMTRDGNTLSMYIREAWDEGNLGTMTKHPQFATDAHISILAHATRQELEACLDKSDTWNGFANRFLWICARRSKLLPFGGAKPDYGQLTQRAHAAISVAREIGPVSWSPEAGARWSALYGPLTRDKIGRLAAATSRAEAHVVRLATLYAVLDMTDVIADDHLLAALCLWRYAEQSARWLFGDDGATDEAADILEALRLAGDAGMNRSALYGIFGGKIKQAALQGALEQLLTSGTVLQRKVPRADGKAGRPAYLYVLAAAEAKGETS